MEERESAQNELDAIRDIAEILRAHPKTQAILEDLEVIPKGELVFRDEVTLAFENLWKRADVINGSKVAKWNEWNFSSKVFGVHQNVQQVVLAQQFFLAAHFSYMVPGIEVCTHRGDGLEKSFRILGADFVKTEKPGCGYVYTLEPSCQDADIAAAFKYMTFPILDLDKKFEIDYYNQNGYKKVLKKTWFCFTPIDGEPCGQCWNCMDCVREGVQLDWFSQKALKRYELMERRLERFKEAVN
jgi:hypothetical protein